MVLPVYGTCPQNVLLSYCIHIIYSDCESSDGRAEMPKRSATRNKCTVTMRATAQGRGHRVGAIRWRQTGRRGRVIGRGKGRARIWRIRRSGRHGKRVRGGAKRKKQLTEHLYKWKVVDQGIM